MSSEEDEEEEEEKNNFNSEQLEVLRRANAKVKAYQESRPKDKRGIIRGTGDFLTGVTSAVPRAAGGLVSIGSLVQSVNIIADPVAEALMNAGDWVDETLLSDYQKNINEDMAQAMANSARELGLMTSIGDHIKNIASQGGAAAKFSSSKSVASSNFLQTSYSIYYWRRCCCKRCASNCKRSTSTKRYSYYRNWSKNSSSIG